MPVNSTEIALDISCLIDNQPYKIKSVRFEQEFETRWNHEEREEPDPEWQFTDTAGHFHAFDNTGRTPTLRTKRRVCPQCRGNCDRVTTYYFVCPECEEEVEPKYRIVTVPPPKQVPTSQQYILDITGPELASGRHSVVIDSLNMFGFMNVSITNFRSGSPLEMQLVGRLYAMLKTAK